MATSNPDPLVGPRVLKNPDEKVSFVMRTDFRSCNASTPVSEAATALRLSECPILPVTQAQVPVGTVTERTLARALAEHGGNLSELTAKDLMDPKPPTVSMTAPAREAVDRLGESGGYLLAVNSDGLLKGIVTLSELGPHLTEGGLIRLVERLHPSVSPSPAEEAVAADPTAEIKSSKSQAQPHPWDSPTREHPAPVPLLSEAGLANPMLTVRDVMTASPRTCSPESSVLEAAAIFRDANCGAVPVVEAGKPVGLLTDRDAILALPEREFELARTPVSEVMSTELVTVEPGASLDSALETFGKAGVRRLLVVDSQGQLLGLLGWTDLVPHLSERGIGHLVRWIAENRSDQTPESS